MERAARPDSRYPRTALAEPRYTAEPDGGYDSLREAIHCLESAGSHLKTGDVTHADEILILLQAATAHLQEALDTPPAPPRRAR